MSILHITQENFDELVLKSEKPVLLDFWATWCGPCRMVAPIVEEIAEENESIVVGKIDVDESRELAMQFGITSIPTLILMKNGEAAATVVGFRPKADLLKMLDI
jgi:thioredoxin 1